MGKREHEKKLKLFLFEVKGSLLEMRLRGVSLLLEMRLSEEKRVYC